MPRSDRELNCPNEPLNRKSQKRMRFALKSKMTPLIILFGLFSLLAPIYKVSAEAVKSAAELAQTKTPASDLEKKLHELDNLYVPIHWSDYITGLAIGGYDPLSYFIAQKSEAGDERFQYLWHGVTWQFISKANLLAFKRTPSVYAPRYAGYDPYAISKGILSEGLPSIWVVEGSKLYLFNNQVNRYLWQDNKLKLHKKIEKNWQELSLDIPRFKVF